MNKYTNQYSYLDKAFPSKNAAISILRGLKQLPFIKDFLNKNENFLETERQYLGAVEALKLFLEDGILRETEHRKNVFYDELEEDIANCKLDEINQKEILNSINDYNTKTHDLINKTNSNTFLDDSHYESIGLNHWETPEIIDTKNIESYFEYLKNCITQFKSVADKWRNRHEKGLANDFQPKPGLDNVVFKDFISQFEDIERELVNREFLNQQGEWIEKKKKIFCEFLVVILNYGYTVKNASDTKVRYFFEERYGKPKKFLSTMFKISKRPKFEDAIITFPFISAPQEKKEISKVKKKPLEF